VKYDRRLTSGPPVKALLAAVRQRASVISRLANHLPRGEYLRQLAYGLVIGKLSHALAAVARPRLEQEGNASVVWSRIQVALNVVAWSITGTQRRDHVRIEDPHSKAGLESANRMVVKAFAAETWGCFHSDDGMDGARNHVGKLLFSGKRTVIAKTTRSATPTRPMCRTSRPCSDRQPKRRHRTWRVSRQLPACGLWGVSCGPWGVSCGTWGVSPGTSTDSFEKNGTSSSARSPVFLPSFSSLLCCCCQEE
jgi:hypothetical protein